ncbi:hypothetical protein SRHO_G00179560 [Serrasalmus rhombeus]
MVNTISLPHLTTRQVLNAGHHPGIFQPGLTAEPCHYSSAVDPHHVVPFGVFYQVLITSLFTFELVEVLLLSRPLWDTILLLRLPSYGFISSTSGSHFLPSRIFVLSVDLKMALQWPRWEETSSPQTPLFACAV